MIKHKIPFLFIFCFVLVSYHAKAWGYWAHRKINNKAIGTLPKGMSGFYLHYIDFVTNHSIDPDKKRYCDMNEGPHHFIDLDHYCTYPCESYPRYWKDAEAQYSEDTLNKYGVLPWYIMLEYHDLVAAFNEKDADKILKLSANLGHYIADSYVPLHTTENYDGQRTGQTGIHALWESTVPEQIGYVYTYKVVKAKYIAKVNEFIWQGILSSSSEVDSVLSIEQKLLKTYPYNKVYCFDTNKSGEVTKRFSQSFVNTYNSKLKGMVEKRLKASVLAVGSMWMSAWVEAGQPDLDKLIGKAKNNDQ